MYKRAAQTTSKPRPAFSLVETLVAVAILTTGLTAGLGLLSFVLKTVQVSLNTLVAAHLAAEGVEVVRNLRDENWLRRDIGSETRGWRDGLPDGSYRVQFDSGLPLSLYEADKFLGLDADGRYCYDCGPPSPFKRKVEIDSAGLDGATQMRVRVTVAWTDTTTEKARNVVVEDVLYDWK